MRRTKLSLNVFREAKGYSSIILKLHVNMIRPVFADKPFLSLCIILLSAIGAKAQHGNPYYQLPVLPGVKENVRTTQTVEWTSQKLTRVRVFSEGGMLHSGYTISEGKQIQNMSLTADCCNVFLNDSSRSDDKIILFSRIYDAKHHVAQEFLTRVIKENTHDEISREQILFTFNDQHQPLTITGRADAPGRLSTDTRVEIAYSKSGQILGMYYRFSNPNIVNGRNAIDFAFIADSTPGKKTFTLTFLNKTFSGEQWRTALAKWDLVNGADEKAAFLKEFEYRDPESALPTQAFVFSYDKEGRLKEIEIDRPNALLPGAGQYLPIPQITEGGSKAKMSYYGKTTKIKERKVFGIGKEKENVTYTFDELGRLKGQSGAKVSYSQSQK